MKNMENFENNENQNPKSLGRLGYNTAFKNNFHFKNNIFSKNQKMAPRTPLKSKINIMNNTNPQPLDYKDNNKYIKYPLLKSISSSNIGKNKYQNGLINNNNILNNNDNEDDTYNENALEDEPDDFMHMNENEIYINNDGENNNISLNKPKMNVCIMNDLNPFGVYGNDNYVFGAHFDENGKKEYDDYFNSPDENENDLNEFD